MTGTITPDKWKTATRHLFYVTERARRAAHHNMHGRRCAPQLHAPRADIRLRRRTARGRGEATFPSGCGTYTISMAAQARAMLLVIKPHRNDASARWCFLHPDCIPE